MGLDQKVPFAEHRAKLKQLIGSKNAKYRKWQRDDKQVKLCILLVQLVNGCRISEAVDAYNQFLQSGGERRQKVRVRKTGFTKKGDDGKLRRLQMDDDEWHPSYRVIVVPEDVPGDLPEYTKGIANITNWAMRRFGLHTHASRYSFITEMGTRGMSPLTVMKITGHKTLQQLAEYMEGQNAERILEGVVAEE